MTPTQPAPASDRAPGRGHLFLIPLAALVAVMPLIHHGCSCGHDFDFHLLNWMEAARQIGQGNLHPHWAVTPAFNAGEPRFVFYPPLSWMLGALLGLLLTHLPGMTESAAWSATPIAFTWIALTLSGLTLHRLARTFVSSNAALLAATLYLANPYMLFTAYERAAYAELLAAAWIPLLFDAILRERVSIPRIAVPLALLWLTNAPAAVMGSYTLALLAAIRVIAAYRNEAAPGVQQAALSLSNDPTFRTWVPRHRSSIRLAFKTFAGTALALALAAFYIVPAAYERRHVQIAMSTIAGMRIDQNFLFEHTGTSPEALLHDQVLHTASLVAILLLAATAIAFAAVFIQRKPSIAENHSPEPSDPQFYRDRRVAESSVSRFPIVLLTILIAGIAFLLTPLSLPLWNHTPQATFLQFPWRLLAILGPIYALTLAHALNKLSGAPSIATLRWVGPKTFAVISSLLIISATLLAYDVFRQPCDSEDTAPARLSLFHSATGTDPTDEYTPTTADNDALSPNDPPYWLAASPTEAPPATVPPGPAPAHFTINAPRAEELILNLRDYPAWRVSLNSAPDAARALRPDGLIAIPIPAGPSTIDIHYGHTLDESLGDAVSLLALAVFPFTLRSRPRKKRQS